VPYASATPAATFVSPKLVDTPPRPISRVLPVYPERALSERVRGVVILRAVVSETGETLRVRVEKGVRPDIDAAAVSAALQWRFEPARKDGRPVRTFTTIRFAFEGVQFARTPFPLDAVETAPQSTATPVPQRTRGGELGRRRTPRPD
jgi:TonB family protein